MLLMIYFYNIVEEYSKTINLSIIYLFHLAKEF